LKQGHNVTTQGGRRIVPLRLDGNTRRQHFADGSKTNGRTGGEGGSAFPLVQGVWMSTGLCCCRARWMLWAVPGAGAGPERNDPMRA
jgi:hypothetical protein